MNRLRGLAAFLVLILVLVGIPYLLFSYGDWPITSLPDRAWLEGLRDSYITDRAIFAVLTVAAWMVWAAFAFSVLVELGAVLRGVHPPKIAIAGPLQHLARGLVAAVVLAASISHSATNYAAATSVPGSSQFLGPNRPPTTLVLAPVSAARPTLLTRAKPSASPGGTTSRDATRSASSQQSKLATTITVRHNDTAWGLAEQHLGDGMRWRELFDANKGVPQADGRAWTDPGVLVEGWALRLPGGTTNSSPISAPVGKPTDLYVVVKGDTLSEIAEDELGDAHRYPEIFELSRDTEQPGHRHLTDPNLILPGWTLAVPIDTPPPVQDTPRSDSPQPDLTDVPLPDVPGRPTTTLPPPTAEAPSSAAPPTTVTTTSPPPAVVSPPTTAAAAGETTDDESADTLPLTPAASRARNSNLALLGGIGGSLALASALTIRINTLRRRRGIRGSASLRRPERHADDTGSITRAGDVPLVRWAGQELAQLVAHLDRRQMTGGPLAVELSQQSGIEILWSTAQQPAPASWLVRDGGAAWVLDYDPDAPTPPNSFPSPIPALVTIGARDGRQLLLDLEAFGSVAVAGPPERVDNFLRSIATELAAGDDLADSFVMVVGLDLPAGPHERAKTVDVDTAIGRLVNISRSVADSLAVVGLNDTFLARVGDPIPLEANVAVIASEFGEAIGGHALPEMRSGTAIIIGADLPGAGCRIELLDDGTARVTTLHLEFVPVSLNAAAAAVIGDVIEELHHLIVAEPPRADDSVPEVHHAESPIDVLAAERTADESAIGLPSSEVSIAEDEDLPDFDEAQTLLVKVLGTPSVPDRPALGRREIVITALLACKEGPTLGSAVQDAVWQGEPIESKTVWNVMSLVRTALGEFPDGAQVLPGFDRSRGKVQLDQRVTTDLALLRRAVKAAAELSSAEAIRVLGAALQHVEGPPFDDKGYDWAYTDQLVNEAMSLVVEGTRRFVDLTLDAGLLDSARDAVSRALRCVPGTECLYQCRIRIEGAANNPAAAKIAYQEAIAALAEVDCEPSTTTIELYEQALRRRVRDE